MSTAWSARSAHAGSQLGEKSHRKKMLPRRMATGRAKTSTAWRVRAPMANATAPSESAGSATNSSIGRR
jgi:hypothetical protein